MEEITQNKQIGCTTSHSFKSVVTLMITLTETKEKRKLSSNLKQMRPLWKFDPSMVFRSLFWSSPVAARVMDLTLSLQQLGSLLWHGFNPWPRNFHMPWVWQKKKKKKKTVLHWSAIIHLSLSSPVLTINTSSCVPFTCSKFAGEEWHVSDLPCLLCFGPLFLPSWLLMAFP